MSARPTVESREQHLLRTPPKRLKRETAQHLAAKPTENRGGGF